ncbi:helicase HerA domain-containing protein [Selenomonas ruminantium]|uniref:helicase HerA domain-containing protein n=1 Tax=Selenomonas ruminantium TaxID=971 RepID=UPI00068E8BFF|nr:DUF87 domain-containing protein [Selenomonas ruminantium]
MKWNGFDSKMAEVNKEIFLHEEMGKKQLPLVNENQITIEPKLDDSQKEKHIEQLSLQEYEQFDRLTILQNNLANCLKIIDDEVMKGYLAKLDSLKIVDADAEALAKLNQIQFFRIDKLAYQAEEFSLHNLATLYRVLSDKPCTLVLMVKSDGITVEFFLGVRPKSAIHAAGTMKCMLEDSLKGLFPGSCTSAYLEEALQKQMENISIGAISSVTCIADFRQNEEGLSDRRFVQGVEKFIDSMKGKSYQAFFVAENASYDYLAETRRGYESIGTQISPFVNMQMNFSLNDSDAEANANSSGKTITLSQNKGVGKTVNDGITLSKNIEKNFGTNTSITVGENKSVAVAHTYTSGAADGVNESTADAHSESTNTTDGSTVGAGAFYGVGVSYSKNHSEGKGSSDTHTVTKGTSHTISESQSISRTLTHGLSTSKTVGESSGISEGEGTARNFGIAINDTETIGRSEAVTLTDSLTITSTLGKSQGITLGAENKTFVAIAKRLEKQLQRLEECESMGMWNFAAYFVGESSAETEMAANIYRSVVSGKGSGIERSAINTWNDEQSLVQLAPYIKNFLHPVFEYQGFDYEGERCVKVTPAVLVSTGELAIHMGLPHTSVKGLPVVNHAAFAREVLHGWQTDSGQKNMLQIGRIFHMGERTETVVDLDTESLASHTFVAGSTGAGKSNVVCHIINALQKQGKKFLVIEPAKGEYRHMFPQTRILGTNPRLGEMLQLNPFVFPSSIHVLEHIDRLVEIFNVCWPMYAAMPAILKEAVERAYTRCGWNLSLSENSIHEGVYPGFADVQEEVRQILAESEYSADNKSDYIGSLVTRLRSLTNGINSLIFSAKGISDEDLFNENVIVDLSRIGSAETKSLLMGLLVLKLQEHRMEERSRGASPNNTLFHVTVLEEAHNLLKRTSSEQTAEGANLLGKSVEMLANSIAEMRTYGEGFIIADQSPGLLDLSVIRNTNTKIILRLPELSDRELVGAAAGLNASQIEEIVKLEKGVAAVSQIDWLEPVLCQIPLYEPPKTIDEKQKVEIKDLVKIEDQLLDAIRNNGIGGSKLRKALLNMKTEILCSPLRGALKAECLMYAKSGNASNWQYFLFEFFDAQKALNHAKSCGEMNSWLKTVKEKLIPASYELAPQQVDILLGIVLREAVKRDGSYLNIFLRFTEEHRSKGGAFVNG